MKINTSTQSFIDVCIVTVAGGKAEKHSTSGVVIHQKSGLIITHASLLHPIVKKGSTILHDLEHVGYSTRPHFDESVSVLFDFPKKVSDNGSNTGIGLLDVKEGTCNKHQTSTSEQANIVFIWRSDNVKEALCDLMPSTDGWKLHNHDDTASDEGDTNFEHYKGSVLLPCFVLLQVRNITNDSRHSLGIRPPLATQGNNVYVIGTPFGDLIPSVFMNSVSKGIVCKTAGVNNCLILTDARCIPGTEGGALCTSPQADHFLNSLIGMVIAPLCWKNNEWIGLALVCCLHEILSSLDIIMGASVQHSSIFAKDAHGTLVVPEVSQMSRVVSLMSRVSDLVVLIKVGGTWGSGTYVDPRDGYIVTCAHVVKNVPHNSNVSMYVPKCGWSKAQILYRTPPGGVYDVAILKVKRGHQSKVALPIQSTVKQGMEVYISGYALFRNPDTNPSITKGIISKVLYHNNQTIMIQSSCAVHGGASGGPLFTCDGHIVGMVTCNARDSVSGASYPHVNMSVPMSLIGLCIAHYKTCQDIAAFSLLHNTHTAVVNAWALQTNGLKSYL